MLHLPIFAKRPRPLPLPHSPLLYGTTRLHRPRKNHRFTISRNFAHRHSILRQKPRRSEGKLWAQREARRSRVSPTKEPIRTLFPLMSVFQFVYAVDLVLKLPNAHLVVPTTACQYPAIQRK